MEERKIKSLRWIWILAVGIILGIAAVCWLVSRQNVAEESIPLLAHKEEGQYHLYYREKNELVLYSNEEWTEYIVDLRDQFYEIAGISMRFTSEGLPPVLFVDDQMNVIKTEKTGSGIRSYSVSPETIYIAIAVKEDDKPELALTGKLSEKGRREAGRDKAARLTDAFEGKSMSVMGDSLSGFENYIPKGYLTYYPSGNVSLPDIWWYLLAKKMGMSLCKINGCGSSGVTDLTGDGLTLEMSASRGRGKELHSDWRQPDVIFVWIGGNDIIKGKTAAEINEAYRRMMQDITESYPEAEIYLCNYYHMLLDHLDQDGQFDQMIQEVADDFQVKTLDLKDCGITAENQAEYLYDIQEDVMLGVHPNKEGFALIVDCMIKQLAESSGNVETESVE